MRKYLNKLPGYVTRTRTTFLHKYYETLIVQEHLYYLFEIYESLTVK